ncbi:MAG: AmmeMemoRadiSam system protein B [Candidatus Thorarchaeota archaeon]
MIVREPIRAGSWYAGYKEGLIRELENMYLHSVGPGKRPPSKDVRKDKKEILGLISPHAGYACSAPTAAHGFLSLAEDRRSIDTVILLGNKHTDLGPEVSVASHDAWNTPLGEVALNKSFLSRVVSNKNRLAGDLAKHIDFDEIAHREEHSIELQIPFLQDIFEDFRIAPIAVGRIPFSFAQALGQYLAEAIRAENLENTTVAIASSDMTHGNYLPSLNHEQVSSLDKLAIKSLVNRNPSSLEEVVRKNKISMCGLGPVMVLLSCTESLGAKSAKVLNYATSGMTCGPMSSVVGYLSMIITKT